MRGFGEVELRLIGCFDLDRGLAVDPVGGLFDEGEIAVHEAAGVEVVGGEEMEMIVHLPVFERLKPTLPRAVWQ